VHSPLPPSASVGENVVVGERVSLGENVTLHPGMRDRRRRDDRRRFAALRECGHLSRLRDRPAAIIHSGAVIGADGFGFAKEGERWIKIPQIGRVVIGDDVEIGANTSIDRGALDDTLIGDGVKLDNQIQIAHNCSIGEHVAMAGCVGIAGSTRIGTPVYHRRRGNDQWATSNWAMTCMCRAALWSGKSLHRPGQYTGVFPLDDHAQWLQNAAQLRRLAKLVERVVELEKKLAANAHG
jgi:UDP-3-O-[3-hydroxymyristoyl] glucosamine N-acyltransferase